MHVDIKLKPEIVPLRPESANYVSQIHCGPYQALLKNLLWKLEFFFDDVSASIPGATHHENPQGYSER